jgi:hypothetical protein
VTFNGTCLGCGAPQLAQGGVNVTPVRSKINFDSSFTLVDNSGQARTDISLSSLVVKNGADTSTTSAAGSATIKGGSQTANSTGAGGQVNVLGGDSASNTNGTTGGVLIRGGDQTGTGSTSNGGDVLIRGGSSTSGTATGNGGDVLIRGGSSSSGGNKGTVYIQDAAGINKLAIDVTGVNLWSATGNTCVRADSTGYLVSASTDCLLDSAGNGILARTSAHTTTNRTIAGTTGNVTVTNGDGVSGNPTIDLGSTAVQTDQSNTYSSGAQDFGSAAAMKIPTSAGAGPTANGNIAYDSTSNTYEGGVNGANKTFATVDGNIATATALAADGSNCGTGQGAAGVSTTGAAQGCTDYMEEPASSGIVARTAANTSAARTITGTTNEIALTNGDGVSGNPTVALATVVDLSGKTQTLPVKATTTAGAPSSCTANKELLIKTDATAGQQLFICNGAGNGWNLLGDGGGGGGVTSVGLALPADFTISNSPVTTSGTLTAARSTETVSFSATPTFNCKAVEKITLTGNVTSSTLSGCADDGQLIVFRIAQDGTGGRTLVWPTNVLGGAAIDTTASRINYQVFRWDATSSKAVAVSCMMTDAGDCITSGYIKSGATGPDTLTAQSAPGTPGAGTGYRWYDSTSKTEKIKDDAGNTSTTVRADTGSTSNFLTAISADGVISKAQPTEADLSTSDITTNNVSTTKHGFAPKAPNDATKYLDGTGAWSVPPGSGGGTPCTTTALSFQYNNAGAFGCVVELTYSGATATYTTSSTTADGFVIKAKSSRSSGYDWVIKDPTGSSALVFYDHGAGAWGCNTRCLFYGTNALEFVGGATQDIKGDTTAGSGLYLKLGNTTGRVGAKNSSGTEIWGSGHDGQFEVPNNVYRVTSDFTTAANTNLQTITGLSWTLRANYAQNVPFVCEITYHQNTATAAVTFGIQSATISPTQIMAKGEIYTSASASVAGNAVVTTTTATNVMAGTPSAITTDWNARMAGMIENPSNASTNTINVMVKTATSGDAVVVKRGSYCKIG